MHYWHQEASFYHIYILGLCNAPFSNDYSTTLHKLPEVEKWITHIKELGSSAVLFSPVFKARTHGYDTTDYYQIDNRLGDNEGFRHLVRILHDNGLKVVLDGVFNHCGRDFFAFKDICAHKWDSAYCDWFSGLDFNRSNPLGDSFNYATWSGYHELVKFNLRHPPVKEHLLGAVRYWIEYFAIDGLRLDAADCLDWDFMRELRQTCCGIKEDFWLMGEVLHGDYRKWANADMLHSVTNYEAYKSLHSSHNDHNLFEMAYSLDRQFAEGQGLYQNITLYNFVDNHDVNRLASIVQNPAYLYTIYILLYTMPGLPSIYYGSEWGLTGIKANGSDQAIRPFIDPHSPGGSADLYEVIRKLAAIRGNSPALLHGSYRKLAIGYAKPFAFERKCADEQVIVVINAEGQKATVNLPLQDGEFYDILNDEYIAGASLNALTLYPYWGRILQKKS